MPPYWNWEATFAPFISDLVFAASWLLQLLWVESTARRMTKYFSTDDSGNPLPWDDDIENDYQWAVKRLSFDADRVQIATTVFTVPFALIIIFDFSKELTAVLFTGAVLVILATFILLDKVVTPEANHWKRFVSKLTMITFIALIIYTLVVLLFVSPAALSATLPATP